MKMKAQSFKKDQALQIWKELEDNQELIPCPIEYKHKGTTIDEDGIRICGSEDFIKAVLSHLKPILQYENGSTRLGISWSEIVDKNTQEVIPGRFRCSIQVHERGPEAQMCNAILDGMRKRQAERAIA